MSTVLLKFLGGPKDGGYRRMSSTDLSNGLFLAYKAEFSRGWYLSNGPYEGVETEVSMCYCLELEFEFGPARVQKIN